MAPPEDDSPMGSQSHRQLAQEGPRPISALQSPRCGREETHECMMTRAHRSHTSEPQGAEQ